MQYKNQNPLSHVNIVECDIGVKCLEEYNDPWDMRNMLALSRC